MTYRLLPGLLSTLALVASVELSASAAPAQSTLFEVYGSAFADTFGEDVDVVGFVDGDAIPDVVVGARVSDAGGTDSGAVFVYSGATGALLHEVFGGPGDVLGFDVAGLDDVDGDGIADFAACAAAFANDSGLVRVYSGLDASVLWEEVGPIPGGLYGLTLESIDDVDQDGRQDLLIQHANAQRVDVRSGADGALIHRLDGGLPGFGRALDGTPDLNGDGVADILVGITGVTPAGRIRAYSGATGAPLFAIGGIDPGSTFGYSIAALGDTDGDGVSDFAVGAPFERIDGLLAGRVRVYSARTRQLLHTLDGGAFGGRFGETVAGPGDIDGDAIPDVAVGSLVEGPGAVRVFSGADGSLLLTVFGNDTGSTFASWFGGSLEATCDLNQDGIGDLIVGAPSDGSLVDLAGSARAVACGAAVAPGDACANPEPILGERVVAFDTSSLTTSGLGAGGCGAVASNDRVFLWSPGRAGSFTLSTEGSAFDTRLAVYRGRDCGAVCIASSDDVGGATWSRVDLHDVELTDAYLIQVGGAGGASGAAQLEIGPFGLGTNYCPANANSTGVAATIRATGSVTVVPNDVVLFASDMPQNALAYFLISRTQGFVAGPAGSAGNLCLGGDIGRFVGFGQILNTGTGGAVSLPIDLTRLPQPTMNVAAMPGDTWNFTCWFRDAIGGSPTSNFTDGLRIDFL
ncbi:MAG: integrin alpha [Planctomycetota bacterium]